MADKTIGELPAVTSLDGDSLFVAQQQGVASKITGAQLTEFANVNPTHVGMNRICAVSDGLQNSKPHARGDEPVIHDGNHIGYIVNPTHVGMNR